MDWSRAIDINKAALTQIVAALVSLLAAQGGAKRLPQTVYRLIARILFPAESAVRRLIIIAARGLQAPAIARHPMPQGLVIAGKGNGRMAFQLFDQRKTFSENAEGDDPRSGPRIRTVSAPDPRSRFLSQFARPADGLVSESATLFLARRVEAIDRALKNLPREAKRLARWRTRRAAMSNPKFTSPIRPGPPPGQRKQGREKIDLVLRECHGLAWDVLREESS